MSAILGYPLDFVRTKLASDLNQKYSGIRDCLRKTVKEHGFFALYDGLFICLVGEIFYRWDKKNLNVLIRISDKSVSISSRR